MTGTLSDQVIDAHLAQGAPGDDYVMVRVDAVLGHDATTALLADEFERRRLRVFDPTRVLLSLDHFSPPADAARAAIVRRYLEFAERNALRVHRDDGICHQLLVESSLCVPGSLIIGADSHTVTGGAISSCATGMGSTDVLFALATGTTWLKRPRTIRVVLEGNLDERVSGRDVALHLVGLLGEEGAQYRTLEFVDATRDGITIEDRCAIANLSVEAGAKFGVFVPDAITVAYCRSRDGSEPAWLPVPTRQATYERTIVVDLDRLDPMVARPWSPANVAPVRTLGDIPITSAFVGSCGAGRDQDLRVAAALVSGRRVHEAVRLVVIPASKAIYERALEQGWIATLVRAGAVIGSPSCGPCGGIDKGILAPTDVCISTSTRNFAGRMGAFSSQTYLASTRTTVLAALAGKIHAGLHEDGP